MRNLKIKYRKSFLGLLWTLLIPAASALVYFIVFKFVMRVQMEHYLIHILATIIPWTFFTACLINCVELLVGNHHLLNKVPLPVNSLVLAEVLTQFLNFILSLPILLISMWLLNAPFSWELFQYPLLAFLLLLLAYPLALTISMAYVYLRDLKFLMTIIVQFWFYLTPVMYASSMIPEKYYNLLYINPVGALFKGFHLATVNPQWLTAQEWALILLSVFLLLGIGYSTYRSLRNNVVEML